MNVLAVFDKVMECVTEWGLTQCKGKIFEYEGSLGGSIKSADITACCMSGALYFANALKWISVHEAGELRYQLNRACPKNSMAHANDDLGWTFDQFREALAKSLDQDSTRGKACALR